jgi:XTP/dITP diphosphohydrolase
VPGRLVLLATSPRVAPGLLSARAWVAILEAQHVLTDDANHPLAGALGRSETGIEVTAPGDLDAVVARARDAVVVHLLGSDSDAVIAEVVTRIESLEDPPDLEVITGSWDLPGAHLLDLVAVMDRLRSPGGCPWDAEQTHASLVEYLVEESYETVEAIETGDDDALREELGDVLLQVAFHARIAEERDAPWSIDDVADGITGKLVKRHPHVFSDHVVRDADEVEANWRRLKAQEKGRESVTDGIPLALPALVLAGKLLRRSAEVDGVATDAQARVAAQAALAAVDGDYGELLLAIAARASTDGVDPEQALREAVRRHRDAVRAAEGLTS